MSTPVISSTVHASQATAPTHAKPSAVPDTDTKRQIAEKAKTSVDKATISSAAQAALQEAMETPAQTAKEARSGDRQAIKLETKLAAKN